MLTGRIPILSRITLTSQAVLAAAVFALYAVALGCMTYCALRIPVESRG